MLRALDMYSSERRRKRGNVIQTCKIVKGLTEVRDRREILFQVEMERNTEATERRL